MEIKISEKQKKINEPRKLAVLLTDILKTESKLDRDKEHFWGIYLDSRNVIKRIELISLGIINSNLVHPREVYSPAIESRSVALIVAHNHPSGDTEPSEADILITKKLEEAGKILDIELLDHLIITTNKGYFSFKENGIL